jgi:hypothetical protein
VTFMLNLVIVWYLARLLRATSVQHQPQDPSGK